MFDLSISVKFHHIKFGEFVANHDILIVVNWKGFPNLWIGMIMS